MKKKFKLRAYWSKEEDDLMLEHPLGIHTKADSHLLHSILGRPSELGGMRFTEELKRRGYDPETLRFEVTIDMEAPGAAERFPTLYKEWKTQNG